MGGFVVVVVVVVAAVVRVGRAWALAGGVFTVKGTEIAAGGGGTLAESTAEYGPADDAVAPGWCADRSVGGIERYTGWVVEVAAMGRATAPMLRYTSRRWAVDVKAAASMGSSRRLLRWRGGAAGARDAVSTGRERKRGKEY